MAYKTRLAATGDRTGSQVASQQMDLFRAMLVQVSASGPAWSDLPEGARDTLIGLMAQLILEHVRVNAAPTAAEGSHDR